MQKKATGVICLLIFGCLLMFSEPVLAQDEPEISSYGIWADFGYGAAGGSSFSGPSFLTNLRYSIRPGIFGVRYSIAGDRTVRTPMNMDYMNQISTLSATYGRSATLGMFSFSLHTGLGASWGDERVGLNAESFTVINIPLEAGVIFQPVHFFGIGFNGAVNFNQRETHGMAMLVLRFGKLY